MKAALARHFGHPEKIRIEDVPTPTPQRGEVLIRVHCATVNRTDQGFLYGSPKLARPLFGIFRPKRPILGTEFAGTIEALGPAATRFQVGDRVFGYSEFQLGAHAQFLVQKEAGALELIPTGIDFQTAAPATEGFHYARNMVRHIGLQAGERVLIHGATGAIGSAAVQIATSLGAAVTATARGQHLELVRSLGAKRVIDYETQDFTQESLRYHHIIDAVGKTRFSLCRHLLEPGGIYTSSELGPRGENLWYTFSTRNNAQAKVRFPFPTDCPASVRLARQMQEQRSFKPLVDRSYPLEQIADAYQYIVLGQKVGNVLVLIPETERATP